MGTSQGKDRKSAPFQVSQLLKDASLIAEEENQHSAERLAMYRLQNPHLHEVVNHLWDMLAHTQASTRTFTYVLPVEVLEIFFGHIYDYFAENNRLGSKEKELGKEWTAVMWAKMWIKMNLRTFNDCLMELLVMTPGEREDLLTKTPEIFIPSAQSILSPLFMDMNLTEEGCTQVFNSIAKINLMSSISVRRVSLSPLMHSIRQPSPIIFRCLMKLGIPKPPPKDLLLSFKSIRDWKLVKVVPILTSELFQECLYPTMSNIDFVLEICNRAGTMTGQLLESLCPLLSKSSCWVPLSVEQIIQALETARVNQDQINTFMEFCLPLLSSNCEYLSKKNAIQLLKMSNISFCTNKTWRELYKIIVPTVQPTELRLASFGLPTVDACGIDPKPSLLDSTKKITESAGSDSQVYTILNI
eukprot:TRINITY_DN2039_c0_g2_i5.p1 TRINITY_DN2039_c0_g2~~TRINITY_DN2039_c0_g2_i5.p1  ORF type:complete len:414 (-),score=68.45 TRINITY_DN2039_c0_g2_i5:1199-2440(-)